MDHFKKILVKALHKGWLLLCAVILGLFEHRIYGELNRFLDARAGIGFAYVSRFLRWLGDTPVGVGGALTGALTLAILAYAYVAVAKEKPKNAARGKKGKPKSGTVENKLQVFFDRYLLVPIGMCLVIACVCGLFLILFGRERAYLNLSNPHPPALSPSGYLVADIVVTNPSDYPARLNATTAQIYVVDDISEKSQDLAIVWFSVYVQVIKKQPIPRVTLGAHQKVGFDIGGPSLPEFPIGPMATSGDVLNGKKSTYFLALTRWIDDFGYHERHFCQGYKRSGPGTVPTISFAVILTTDRVRPLVKTSVAEICSGRASCLPASLWSDLPPRPPPPPGTSKRTHGNSAGILL